MEPDAQLVQGCLRGEGPAWEELVRRHTRRVFNLCYRFTGNSTEAEDLSQEVFLRIYRTLASYRPAYGAFPDVAHQRHAKSVGRSLPPHASRSADGFN